MEQGNKTNNFYEKNKTFPFKILVSSDIIKQYAVEKLEKLLQMIFNITSFLSSLITNDCVYICEALVRTIELCQSDDLQSHAQNIIKSFIRSDIVKSNSKAQIMHCFFNISQLAEERDRLMKILTENAKYKRDWKGIIDDFIQQSSYSLESLHNLKQQVTYCLCILLLPKFITFLHLCRYFKTSGIFKTITIYFINYYESCYILHVILNAMMCHWKLLNVLEN